MIDLDVLENAINCTRMYAETPLQRVQLQAMEELYQLRAGKSCGSEDAEELLYEKEKATINRLAEYEDAKEQGLLLKLPCKRVWCIVDAKTKYAYVFCKAIDDLTISEIRGIDKKGYYYSTAEKAEKALADMNER